MNLNEALDQLPKTDQNVVSVLSGGLDSSVVLMLLIEKYGRERVSAVSYNYGQKQLMELAMAQRMCLRLGVAHDIFELPVLGEIAKPVSANIDGTDVSMPTIKDVLGDPQPVTYVPFRNMILLSLTLAQAETLEASHIFCGLQIHDEYCYCHTTQKFVDSMNAVTVQNRQHQIGIVAPFAHLSKAQEIELAIEMNNFNELENTLSCYNPNVIGISCGTCPTCAERIANFIKVGREDPIPYAIDIDWNDPQVKEI